VNAKAATAAARAAAAAAKNPDLMTLDEAEESGRPSASAVVRASLSGGQQRSAAATEGIELLKRGCEAIKLTRKGRPRATTFRLSDDESKLSWDGKLSMRLGQPRTVFLADVMDVHVGQMSTAFERYQQRPAPTKALRVPEPEVMPHLSLSLVLIAGLPAPPSEMDDELESGSSASSGGGLERATLDMCVIDEETFGLWVAALRALTTEVRMRPQAYPSPMAPMHASAAATLAKDAPPDATKYELMRDGSLRCLAFYVKTAIFAIITVAWALCVVVFGALYAFLLFGWHGMTTDDANDLANVSIQILTALFSYILFLTLPWRISNALHLMGRRRSCEAGVDMYGRPTNSIW
jgi:hypothetical protein